MATANLEEVGLQDNLDEPFHEGLIHQAVVTYRANQRQDTVHVKSRSDVSGANSKPWPQKGTGRSRHGSEISPLWVGGGQTQVPDGTQDHGKKLTRSMKQKAFRSALSERNRNDQLHLVEPPSLDEPSTATMHEWFSDLEFDEDSKVLLLLEPEQETLRLSVRNLPYCQPYDAGSVSTYDIVNHPDVLVTNGAQSLLEERI